MVSGGLVRVDGVEHYRIDGVEEMEPFLMTVVSDTDLWMFASSTGALTAGRVDADHALFPYVTDDRIHRAAANVGPVTIIARQVDGERRLWRPFDRDLTEGCTRSVAKSVQGDRLVFEEHHAVWDLTFRSTWAPSDRHGWVRTVELTGHAGHEIECEVLDGLVDVMPAGVDALTEQIRSNLVDAYKRSETGRWGTLALFTLESLITDRAEPAEALTATTVWSIGFPDAEIDLDGRAVAHALAGRHRDPSHLVTGRPGAYLLRGRVAVPASGAVTWTIVADTGLAHADVVAAARAASAPDAATSVADDVRLGSERLRALLEGADGFQATADGVADAHHLSNVLFNSMRGGVFPYGHRVPVADLVDFVADRNHDVAERHRSHLRSLGEWVDVDVLRRAALATGDAHLIRLVLEYLPLTFSRRHGDPSRPWNRFSIEVRTDDGAQLLSYEGNWRDIFQNWEALLRSYPAFHAHVVAKFVNATTIDGYNPYRISRAGIDWEVPDPHDPWSHIGYWGDHQIVYLLRLLETWAHHDPGAIREWLQRPVFSYADVPYVLADHEAIVRDPRATITYDEDHATEIARRVDDVGADGRLLVGADGTVLHVGLLEKLLVPALGKLSNFVPGGGIWLNTQRPEWNDANNALAGPGLSMVTLYHLHRYLAVVARLIDDAGVGTAEVTASVADWLADALAVLERHRPGPIDDRERREILDALGTSASAHRRRVRSCSRLDPVELQIGQVRRLIDVALAHLEHSIHAGRRDDGLYHSYNRVSFPTDDTARVDHLGPMLEGQVAVLSSGTLPPVEAAMVVDALFDSEMYRADQDSFLLYPATRRAAFLDRNLVPDGAAAEVLAVGPLDGPLRRVVAQDADGRLRFRPEIVNAAVLDDVLDRAGIVEGRDAILDVYEQVFDHRSFTGRSGGMYGYEGLGSIYWHMVAKLLLAVQETYWAAVDGGEPDAVVARLGAGYRRIRAGLGFRKDPLVYGAIPTDCYSHTPAHAGAQQPGMTGQVKEEVLTRLGELGLRVVHGRIVLDPGLIAPDEVLPTDPDGRSGPARFTVCSVPMTIDRAPDDHDADAATVVRRDGTREVNDGLALTESQSRELLARSGAIAGVEWIVGSRSMDRWARRI